MVTGAVTPSSRCRLTTLLRELKRREEGGSFPPLCSPLSAAQKFDFYPTQGIVDGFKLKPIEVENVAAAAQLIFIKDYDY